MIPRRKVATSTADWLGLVRRGHGAGGAPAVSALERAVAELTGVPHAVAVSSGRRAMRLILEQLEIGAGHEVIVPAYTLGALVPLIQDLGAAVIPADIHPETLNMNPAAVEARINERTRAIIALHAFGAPCQADVLAELARRYGVHLVEDCAHSLGAQLGGQQTGCFGTAGFFSFETTKPLNTWGGGMLVTRDARLAARARELSEGATASRRGVVEKMLSVRAERWLMSTGLSAPLLYLLASPRTADRTNAFYRNFQHAPASHGRYLPLQATFGLQRLAALEQRRAARERSVALYRRHLDPRVHIQRLTDGSSSTWYFLVVQLPVPSAPVRLRLLRRGIDAGVGHEIADDCAALLGFHDCPEVTRVQRFALNLPLWDDMPERSIRRVARTLNRLL